MFDSFDLPRPRIVVNAETAIGMMMVAAYSDLLAMLPQQWAEVATSTGLIRQIAIREVLLAPTICFVRRARLPLTPAAEHLGDLFQRAADNHARTLISNREAGSTWVDRGDQPPPAILISYRNRCFAIVWSPP